MKREGTGIGQKVQARSRGRADVAELLEQLSPLDIRVLQWLLHYPFQRVEDLTVACGISQATGYRHVEVLQRLDLIEYVSPAALSLASCHLYHLTNTGLHVLASYEQAEPEKLAEAWGSDERGLLRLLPRLRQLL